MTQPATHFVPMGDHIDHTVPGPTSPLLVQLGDTSWGWVKVPHRGLQTACVCGPEQWSCKACGPVHAIVRHFPLDDRETTKPLDLSPHSRSATK